MPKILASDLDGTLLKDDKTINRFTILQINKMIEEGHYFVICTGRPSFRTKDIEKMLFLKGNNQFVINYNGGLIRSIDNSEIVFKHFMDKDLSTKLINYAILHDIHLMVYTETNIYVDKIMPYISYVNDYEELIILNKELMKDIKNIIKIIYLMDENNQGMVKEVACTTLRNYLNFFQSSEHFLEILPKEVSKGLSLIRLAKYLNVDIKDVYACGDEENDLPMLKAAGVGVCVANANKRLLPYVKIVTSSNEEDGVGNLIKDYILKDENTSK